MEKLKISKANAKLAKLEKLTKKKVFSLSKLSGWTCPGSLLCKSRAVELPNGKRKVEDGPFTEFRCYSASIEAQYPEVYKLCQYNTELLQKCKTVEEIIELIEFSLPKLNSPYIFRISESGDISRQIEFDAWLEIARQHPNIIFYAYTKSLIFWERRLEEVNKIPNLRLTASYGGLYDDKIKELGLRYCKVVKSRLQARKLGLPVDKSEKFAALSKTQNFSLLLHGSMPSKETAKNPSYSRAWQRIKQSEGGYSRKKL